MCCHTLVAIAAIVTELCSLRGGFCCEETVFIIQTVCICHEVGGEVEETVKH